MNYPDMKRISPTDPNNKTMTPSTQYNPAKHHRRSIRLKGYDYSQPGAYFITICTQNRQCLFGEIIGGKLILNYAGKMIEKWYFEIGNKFSEIKCDEYAIMPNHFHCIIEIPIPPVRMALCGHPNHESPICLPNHGGTSDDNISKSLVRMALCGLPNPEFPMAPRGNPDLGDTLDIHDQDTHINQDTHAGVSLRGSPVRILCGHPDPESEFGDERVSIFEIMDWFKTMTTNEYIRGVKSGNWQRFEKRVWQLRYWDHIIRDEQELFRIQQYIKNNPENWVYDKLNGGTGNHVFEKSVTYGEESWMI